MANGRMNPVNSPQPPKVEIPKPEAKPPEETKLDSGPKPDDRGVLQPASYKTKSGSIRVDN